MKTKIFLVMCILLISVTNVLGGEAIDFSDYKDFYAKNNVENLWCGWYPKENPVIPNNYNNLNEWLDYFTYMPSEKKLYVINKKNIEKYRDVLPITCQSHVEDYDVSINVYEPAITKRHPLFDYYTQKYKGTCKIADDNETLLNWKAGVPFPEITKEEVASGDPKALAKLMWNLDKGHWDDESASTFALMGTEWDGRGRSSSRQLIQMMKEYSLVGRYLHGPGNHELDNPRKIQKYQFCTVLWPAELQGFALLTHRFIDQKIDDDAWQYIPGLRRVRRASVSQRSDSVAGTSTTWDSWGGYGWKAATMKWKFIDKKPIVCSSQATVPIKNRVSWEADLKDTYRALELKDYWIIELTPKARDYAEGKKIIYVTSDLYKCLYTMTFDRKGRIWRDVNCTAAVRHAKNQPPEEVGHRAITCQGGFRGFDYQAHRNYVSENCIGLADYSDNTIDFTIETLRKGGH